MKKSLKLGCESKLSHRSQALFQFASQTRGAMLRGLPLWYGLRLGGAVFAAAKNDRDRAAARNFRLRAGEDNAALGRLHLIRFATLSTFPSRGRLFA